MKKRVATYCFYDPKGEVAQYKVYYLSQLVKFVDRLVIVCNVELTSEGRSTLEQFTEDIIICENTCFDFWAHKAGIEYIGWDALEEYDNYLLCNDTCYGPIFSLEEVFDKMDKLECDFWGIMLCPEDNGVTSANGLSFSDSYSKEYLWGVFINVNTQLLKSDEFKEYWGTLKNVFSYTETFVYGEYYFTDYFRDCGFKYDSWYNAKALNGNIPLIFQHIPYKLLRDNGVPFLWKKAVDGSIPLSNLWNFSYGNEAYRALEYIEQCTDYDAGMIWDDILCNNHLSDIQGRLQLEYIVSENYMELEYTYDKKIAVICHMYYADLVEECAGYSENFPEGTDFYLTTTTEETMAKIHQEYSTRGLSYQVQIIPNQGRDAPSLFVTYAHIVTGSEYEYICYFHDKKSAHMHYKEVGAQFKLRCYNALFGTKNIVKNIINKFEGNPHLGIISNPPPYHNGLFGCELRTWKRNFEGIKEMAEQIGLNIPLSNDKAEPAPYGAMFWFRAVALKKMLAHGFTYNDFADITPEKIDGTISHAIERIYGLAAQDSSYYLAYIISDVQARSELVNYQTMMFGNKGIVPLVRKYVLQGSGYQGFISALEMHLQKTILSNILQLFKKIIKCFVPRFIWEPFAKRRQQRLAKRLNID